MALLLLATRAIATPAMALEPVLKGGMFKGGGHHKIGAAYEIKGKLYTPTDTDDLVETGIASWYGPDFHGKKTANGEIYDMSALTAAHKTMPLPSYAYVTNLQNGRRILVRVNDRGPFVGDRLIDLSHGVAQLLGYFDRGLTEVRVEYAGPAPLNGDDSHERQVLAEQAWSNDAGRPGPPGFSAPTVVASAGAYLTTAAPVANARAAQPRPLVKAEPLVRIPPVVAATVVRTKPKPVKTASVPAGRGSGEDGSGYKPLNLCWSCTER